jgi:hypothetical protein
VALKGRIKICEKKKKEKGVGVEGQKAKNQ